MMDREQLAVCCWLWSTGNQVLVTRSLQLKIILLALVKLSDINDL